MKAHVCTFFESSPASDKKMEEIKKEQSADKVCMEIKRSCLSEWLEQQELGNKTKGELTGMDGHLMKGNQIVIPQSLQRDTPDKIHQGHKGITKCHQRANRSVWWPRTSQHIKTSVENFGPCCEQRYSPAEPLMPTPFPKRPRQTISSVCFTLKIPTYY